jgi:hypothetical protein
MRFTRLIQLTASAFIIGALIITSACKKDSTSGGVLSSKCDYSPYSVGTKLVYTTNTAGQLATDTITGDTSIGGVRYAKVSSKGPSTSGTATTTTAFIRCDANGVYTLIDQGQLGGIAVTGFTPKEIQSIKLPATVGQTWKSDTIKYSTSQGINVAVLYKMKTTAVGGSKTVNGVAYANGLVTVQFNVFTFSSIAGFTFADSSIVTSNVFDKTNGFIEVTQNGVVSKALKTATIK